MSVTFRSIYINFPDTNFARRTYMPLSTLNQPPGTLMDCFPSFQRWETERNTLGNDGFIDRTSTFARMSPPELVELHKVLSERITITRDSITSLSNDLQSMSFQLSEVMMVLSLHRTYETQRSQVGHSPVHTGPPASPAICEPPLLGSSDSSQGGKAVFALPSFLAAGALSPSSARPSVVLSINAALLQRGVSNFVE